MCCRHYVKDVGPNGFAVLGAASRDEAIEGDGRLGQLQRRTTSMSQLRDRMIADMTAAGWTDGFAEWEFAVREATRRSSLWVFGS
jgi:hypothetical protein